MLIRALRQHRSTVGFHAEGDEYEDTDANSEMKIRMGIVEEVKKAIPAENKKSAPAENKGRAGK